MSNPLLDFSALPAFDRITPADVAPAIDTLLARADAALETVTAPGFPADWTAIARVLDVATVRPPFALARAPVRSADLASQCARGGIYAPEEAAGSFAVTGGGAGLCPADREALSAAARTSREEGRSV